MLRAGGNTATLQVHLFLGGPQSGIGILHFRFTLIGMWHISENIKATSVSLFFLRPVNLMILHLPSTA